MRNVSLNGQAPIPQHLPASTPASGATGLWLGSPLLAFADLQQNPLLYPASHLQKVLNKLLCAQVVQT